MRRGHFEEMKPHISRKFRMKQQFDLEVRHLPFKYWGFVTKNIRNNQKQSPKYRLNLFGGDLHSQFMEFEVKSVSYEIGWKLFGSPHFEWLLSLRYSSAW